MDSQLHWWSHLSLATCLHPSSFSLAVCLSLPQAHCDKGRPRHTPRVAGAVAGVSHRLCGLRRGASCVSLHRTGSPFFRSTCLVGALTWNKKQVVCLFSLSYLEHLESDWQFLELLEHLRTCSTWSAVIINRTPRVGELSAPTSPDEKKKGRARRMKKKENRQRRLLPANKT